MDSERPEAGAGSQQAEAPPSSLMLTQGQVERELARLVEAGEETAHLIADLAEAAARAEVAYKTAYSKALLRSEGTVEVRKAQATVMTDTELLEHKIADAKLLGAQESARTIRSSMDALRSVNATVRHAVGVDW